jgi:hypothetical protein
MKVIVVEDSCTLCQLIDAFQNSYGIYRKFPHLKNNIEYKIIEMPETKEEYFKLTQKYNVLVSKSDHKFFGKGYLEISFFKDGDNVHNFQIESFVSKNSMKFFFNQFEKYFMTNEQIEDTINELCSKLEYLEEELDKRTFNNQNLEI